MGRGFLREGLRFGWFLLLPLRMRGGKFRGGPRRYSAKTICPTGIVRRKKEAVFLRRPPENFRYVFLSITLILLIATRCPVDLALGNRPVDMKFLQVRCPG